MSITTVGARIIHYEALGRGEPLIFVHGWLGSWRYWWPSMQSLSTHYRTFALDLWGFGDSSKDPRAYNLDAYAKMLDEFVETAGYCPAGYPGRPRPWRRGGLTLSRRPIRLP
jgi:3-oxoadipate enol-lactonase